MIVFSVALGLIALYFLIKSQKAMVPIKVPTTLEVLKRRYAAGQISREEYMVYLQIYTNEKA
jgi:putative membrane protein